MSCSPTASSRQERWPSGTPRLTQTTREHGPGGTVIPFREAAPRRSVTQPRGGATHTPAWCLVVVPGRPACSAPTQLQNAPCPTSLKTVMPKRVAVVAMTHRRRRWCRGQAALPNSRRGRRNVNLEPGSFLTKVSARPAPRHQPKRRPLSPPPRSRQTLPTQTRL